MSCASLMPGPYVESAAGNLVVPVLAEGASEKSDDAISVTAHALQMTGAASSSAGGLAGGLCGDALRVVAANGPLWLAETAGSMFSARSDSSGCVRSDRARVIVH